MEKSVIEMVKSVGFGMHIVYRLFANGKLTSQTIDIRESVFRPEVEVNRSWKGTPSAFVKFHTKYNFELCYQDKVTA
jgi:hypothetical protein